MAVPLHAMVELVADATNYVLKEVDWQKVVAIADALNSQPDPIYCGKVVEAIVKRLKNKNPEVGIHTLNLVDYLVKNCERFHRHVATKSFMKTMVGLTEDRSKKLFARLRDDSRSAQMELRERALVLIQIWGKEFGRRKGNPFPIFALTYNDLMGRGVRFPQPQKDEVAPVFTPAVQVRRKQGVAPPAADAPFTDAECMAANENACVLHDLISASKDNDAMMGNDLVSTLYQNCRGAQARFMERVQAGPSEDLLGELLRVNDTLVEVIQYFEGVRDNKVNRYRAPSPPMATPAAVVVPSQGAPPLLPVPVASGTTNGSATKKKKKKKTVAATEPVDFLFFDAPAPSSSKKADGESDDDDDDDDDDGDGDGDDCTPGGGGGEEEKKTASAVLSIPKLAPPPVVPLLRPPGGDAKSEKKKRKKKKGGKSPSVSPAQPPASAPAPAMDDLFASLRLGDDHPAPTNSAGAGAGAAEEDDDPFLALATRTSSSKPESGIRQPENILDAFDLLAKR